ncbi:60S ribosomal protein L9-2 [Porphyridium purpureum]|uniref:60S ribosomal protein L9-2 n=1 Tax=Porphyridium purpureum TaxID=35688 RepID=A0A5J4YHJ6_PORPP|nr:60S ribosomal protein L9-2 [Porphyridium purpureum]KAA8492880.1 60S ribosomal protein L9-2 [Porphyridium purpureum]|eukprot:POR3450..scf237_24
MKLVLTTEYITIPKGVEVKVNARQVAVKGPRGELSRDLRHAQVDISRPEENELRVDMWHAPSKVKAGMNSICSAIRNMIVGVTQGFQYKMRFVYAHFPINVSVEGTNSVEIRNFLGEKRVRVVQMLDGVTCYRSDDIKDELVIEGNDINMVSQSAALVHQSCLVKKKDIRKFLDGIYVSARGNITQLD